MAIKESKQFKRSYEKKYSGPKKYWKKVTSGYRDLDSEDDAYYRLNFERKLQKELKYLINNHNVDINGKLKVEEEKIPRELLQRRSFRINDYVQDPEEFANLKEKALEKVLKKMSEGPEKRSTLKNRRKYQNKKRNRNVDVNAIEEKSQSSTTSESDMSGSTESVYE